MKHLRYLRYIIIHKWFVMIACFRYGLYWQGIIHDWSKFLPSEWFAYVDFFYGEKYPKWSEISNGQKMAGYPWELTRDYQRERFDCAWLKHQHRNPHHWQHWILKNDDGSQLFLQMPSKFVLEMLADWDGAGRAITGKSGGTRDWYAKNYAKMCFNPMTREAVNNTLNYFLAGK